MSAKKQPQIIIMPTAQEVVKLETRAMELRKIISDAEEELKGIEARLEAYALEQPHEKLEDETREGRRVTLAGGARIVFTSDALIGTFKDQSPKHHELIKLADEKLPKLFKAPCDWKRIIEDGNKFRREVERMFAPATAAAFITACRSVDANGIPKSKTVFEYHEQ